MFPGLPLAADGVFTWLILNDSQSEVMLTSLGGLYLFNELFPEAILLT